MKTITCTLQDNVLKEYGNKHRFLDRKKENFSMPSWTLKQVETNQSFYYSQNIKLHPEVDLA